MPLELLDQLSLPGDSVKLNEDSFAFFERGALVMDGATPLGPPLLPGTSDALWIAQFGARRLIAHLKEGDDPKDALAHALADAEKSFAGLSWAPVREKWQIPCASMMLMVDLGQDRPSGRSPELAAFVARNGPQDHSVRLGRIAPHPPRTQSALEGEVPVAGSRAGEGRRGSTIEFLWFGDCTALIEQNGRVELVGDALKARGEEAERARHIARQKNLETALGVNRPEILPMLRAARNRINSGANWLFSPDARAADHVSSRALHVAKGARLLLASDGFLALVSDYGAYDAESLMESVRRKGLDALGQELRAIERDDADGRTFARFKTSDDATALFLQLA